MASTTSLASIFFGQLEQYQDCHFPKDIQNAHNAIMKRFLKACKRFIIKVFAASLCFSFLLILQLRWVNPPITSFMFIRQIEVWQHHQSQYRLHYDWKNLDQISRQLQLAVISSEDQKFPSHFGIDFNSIYLALNQWRDSGHLRGASTISQQVTKNLFLWSSRSLWRKSLEAYLTIMLELLLDKQRILELYLNIAEFGDGIYGAEAASKVFFKHPALQLSKTQSSILAAVLPNPKRLHANRPSQHLIMRSRWILKQMHQLGGTRFLKKIDR